jgi:hypothetical protein
LRVGTASFILRQLGWQDNFDKPAGSKLAACAFWATFTD